MIEFILSAPFVICAVIGIAITIAVLLEFEKNGWATTLFSVGTALVLWAYRGEIWDFVSSNPMPTFYFTLSYILAGVVWSFIKWKVYINKRVDKFEEVKNNFSKTKEIKTNWKEWISDLNYNIPSYLRNSSFYESDTPEKVGENMIPKANEKKSLIVSWISYWPMSVGATLLNNPFRRLFEWVYGMVSGIYDRMGSSAANRISSGLEKNEEPGAASKPKKELLKS